MKALSGSSIAAAARQNLVGCLLGRGSALWLDKRCVFVAWVGILLAIACPPDGLGISLCWHYGATGIPCIGCGMTRSLSCALRGLFSQSWHYHPMGIPILALFLLTAAQSLLPEVWRNRLKAFIENRATAFGALYIAFVGMFVAFGSVRALLCWINH